MIYCKNAKRESRQKKMKVMRRSLWVILSSVFPSNSRKSQYRILPIRISFQMLFQTKKASKTTRVLDFETFPHLIFSFSVDGFSHEVPQNEELRPWLSMSTTCVVKQKTGITDKETIAKDLMLKILMMFLKLLLS